MTLSLDNNGATYQIKAYRNGMIQINADIFTQSLIVSATEIIPNWSPQYIAELTKDDVAMIAQLKPDLILLGTGEKLVFPPLELYGDLLNQGIGVEIMTTHSACTTFNVLTAEGRRVVAGLIIS